MKYSFLAWIILVSLFLGVEVHSVGILKKAETAVARTVRAGAEEAQRIISDYARKFEEPRESRIGNLSGESAVISPIKFKEFDFSPEPTVRVSSKSTGLHDDIYADFELPKMNDITRKYGTVHLNSTQNGRTSVTQEVTFYESKVNALDEQIKKSSTLDVSVEKMGEKAVDGKKTDIQATVMHKNENVVERDGVKTVETLTRAEDGRSLKGKAIAEDSKATKDSPEFEIKLASDIHGQIVGMKFVEGSNYRMMMGREVYVDVMDNTGRVVRYHYGVKEKIVNGKIEYEIREPLGGASKFERDFIIPYFKGDKTIVSRREVQSVGDTVNSMQIRQAPASTSPAAARPGFQQ